MKELNVVDQASHQPAISTTRRLELNVRRANREHNLRDFNGTLGGAADWVRGRCWFEWWSADYVTWICRGGSAEVKERAKAEMRGWPADLWGSCDSDLGYKPNPEAAALPCSRNLNLYFQKAVLTAGSIWKPLLRCRKDAAHINRTAGAFGKVNMDTCIYIYISFNVSLQCHQSVDYLSVYILQPVGGASVSLM